MLPLMPRPQPARLAWPLLACLTTFFCALAPFLRDRTFYMRGDTGTQFVPTWFHLGELVRSGTWPVWMDPDAWAGGNYAAEALFGVYSPLSPLLWLAMSASPDLAVGMFAVKAATLVALTLGTYLVAREYGAERWAAAVMSVALPFSSFTLYWDAASWAAGLVAFAHVPWVWWAFRRVLRGTMNPLWGFLVGALAITQGNPYGVLGVVLVGAGLLVEGVLTRNGRGAFRLLLLGGCVAALLPLVYLPLLAQQGLTYREAGALFENYDRLRPNPGDLLGLSSPTFVPDITVFGARARVPSTYFAWFVLPLLPWFRFEVLRQRARELSGAALLALGYLLLALGPSKLWLFRWPLRHVEYLYLGLAVLLAVLLSAGLHRTDVRRRVLASGGLVALTGWLTWSQEPAWLRVSVGGPLLLVALTAGLLGWHLWGPRRTQLLAIPLLGGTVVVLLAQILVFPANGSLRNWKFPTDVEQLRADFDDRDGTVLQFATHFQKDKRPGDPWADYLGGTMYHVADVDSVNTYSGMGYAAFTSKLCLRYNGFTLECSPERAWRPAEPGEPALVDLMKVDTVVVQPKLAPGFVTPEGWTAETDRHVIVLRRDEAQAYPGSRLSWADGVEVTRARTIDDHTQHATVATRDGGRLVFALLDWPGYRATLDGKELTVKHDAAGLLTVVVPPGSRGEVELTFEPPGLRPGLAAAAAGLLGALVLGLLSFRSGRRRAGGVRAPDPAAAG